MSHGLGRRSDVGRRHTSPRKGRAMYSCGLFFFNDTATTEIYTLSLHDALPISVQLRLQGTWLVVLSACDTAAGQRSEEHTSELQSRSDLVCRLLLEKKKS